MDEMQPVVSEKRRFNSQDESKTFALSCLLGSQRFRCKKTFTKTMWMSDSLLSQNCWLRPGCEKVSVPFWKTRIWISRLFIWKGNYWHSPPIKLALPGTKRNNWHYRMFLQVMKKLTDTLKWKAATVFWKKNRFVFQEKSDHSLPQLLAIPSTEFAMEFLDIVVGKLHICTFNVCLSSVMQNHPFKFEIKT